MIPVGQPQHLGRKTFIIMFLKGVAPGLVLLILVVILSFFREIITQNLTTNLSLMSEVMPALGNIITSFIPFLVPTIFFLAIILGCIGIVINILQYKFFVFTIEEFGLRLKKGVLSVEEIVIPYRQMQNIDVTRPLIYRLFGISRLVIFSAGHEQVGEPEQTDTVFDPIDCELAQEIRELLGRRIGVQVVEHESEADREALENR